MAMPIAEESSCRRRRRRRPFPAQAPWHFLNFLPEPHQHGSLRPILSRSATVLVAVATEPPPAKSPPAVTEAPLPPPSASAAAPIACEPATWSCSYASPAA